MTKAAVIAISNDAPIFIVLRKLAAGELSSALMPSDTKSSHAPQANKAAEPVQTSVSGSHKLALLLRLETYRKNSAEPIAAMNANAA